MDRQRRVKTRWCPESTLRVGDSHRRGANTAALQTTTWWLPPARRRHATHHSATISAVIGLDLLQGEDADGEAVQATDGDGQGKQSDAGLAQRVEV